MSLDTERAILLMQQKLEQIYKQEIPPTILPWSQRVLNPFPLVSSGGAWGDMGQPWPVVLLAFYATVTVQTTNNGGNFWTLNLVNSAVVTLATVNTSALTAGVGARLSTTTITQPAVANVALAIIVTATGSPGAIFIEPCVPLIRSA